MFENIKLQLDHSSDGIIQTQCAHTCLTSDVAAALPLFFQMRKTNIFEQVNSSSWALKIKQTNLTPTQRNDVLILPHGE